MDVKPESVVEGRENKKKIIIIKIINVRESEEKKKVFEEKREIKHREKP